MADKIRSGQELLDEFFNEIETIKGVDQSMANIVKNLYKEKKLTKINLSNELAKVRGEILSD